MNYLDIDIAGVWEEAPETRCALCGGTGSDCEGHTYLALYETNGICPLCQNPDIYCDCGREAREKDLELLNSLPVKDQPLMEDPFNE